MEQVDLVVVVEMLDLPLVPEQEILHQQLPLKGHLDLVVIVDQEMVVEEEELLQVAQEHLLMVVRVFLLHYLQHHMDPPLHFSLVVEDRVEELLALQDLVVPEEVVKVDLDLQQRE